MARILVVDDEKDTLEFFAEEFEDRGFHVDTAISGADAIESVKTHKPDLIFLDVRMPGMDGIEALTKLKDYDPDLKVVMMTAVQDEEIVAQAMALGAVDYITKPVSLDYLDNVIMDKISSLTDSQEENS